MSGSLFTVILYRKTMADIQKVELAALSTLFQTVTDCRHVCLLSTTVFV